MQLLYLYVDFHTDDHYLAHADHTGAACDSVDEITTVCFLLICKHWLFHQSSGDVTYIAIHNVYIGQASACDPKDPGSVSTVFVS